MLRGLNRIQSATSVPKYRPLTPTFRLITCELHDRMQQKGAGFTGDAMRYRASSFGFSTYSDADPGLPRLPFPRRRPRRWFATLR